MTQQTNKTKFSQNNNIFTVHDSRAVVVHDQLPPAVYVLKVAPDIGYYLELTENFELPSKMYGKVERDAQRILATFAARPYITGVLLTGERGSGKTMLAKKVSLDAQKLGMPTILVNAPYVGDGFNSFVQAIEQDAIFLFDEFEKVYDANDQQKLLTVLDGTVITHKLIMFTSNSKWKVNEHMQNRPGRIFYLKEYDGIDEKFIEEYCLDNLNPELRRHTPVIQQYATMFYAFNFDMLKAIVEEMNRFNETPQEAVEMLNAKPGFSSGDMDYDLVLTAPAGNVIRTGEWSGSPLTKGDTKWSFTYWTNPTGQVAHNASDLNGGKEVTNADVATLKLKRPEAVFLVSEHIEKLEKNGTLHLRNAEGFTLVLTKKKPKPWTPSGYLGNSNDYGAAY